MVFAASSQVIIISPILPNISAEINVPESRLSLLVTAYALFLGMFALMTGPISDKLGRRRILLLGCAAMSFALFLHAIANSFMSLLAVRILAGSAGGMLSGAAVAYVGDYFPYERRGWANGWVMSGVAAGQIVGIPLGKFLAGILSFRWPFIVYGIAMLIALLLVAQFVPQPDVKRSKGPLTISRSISNYAQLLKETKIVAAAAAYTLMFSGIGLYLVFLPTWLETEVLLSNNDIVFLFLIGGVMNVLTGPLAGRVSDRVGRKPLIISSCIGLSIIMVATTLVVDGKWMAYAFFGLAMVMIAMRISPFQALITALVSADRRGILMSLSIAIGQVGMASGSALAGFVYERFGDYGYFSNTLLGAIGMMAMAFVVWQFIPEPDGSEG
ncbi:MAG: MFS transporter [Rhodothermaceae bacterium]|nr:MFS transporter [Rhodothermaceae bacterium]